MVRVTREALLRHIQASNKGKRMPFLYAINRSLGWSIGPEGAKEEATDIRTHCFDVSQEEIYLTCMALSDDMDLIALGSGQVSGNLYFVKGASSAGQWECIHVESLQLPIHSIDWRGEHLLVGSTIGTVRLYHVPRYLEEDHCWQITLIAEYTTELPKDITLSPFTTFNSHVNAVHFASNYVTLPTVDVSGPVDESSKSNQFLATFANQLVIWNTLDQNQPTSRITAGQMQLHCASWSPHAPCSLIVTGGSDMNLQVIDTRSNSVVWRAVNAHTRPICDAKFNPFIPYWLASAGEDGVVNIWDIRSSKHVPVGKIDGHAGVIAWSNVRPERIATASSDETFRLWSLNADVIPIWDSLDCTVGHAIDGDVADTDIWNKNVIDPWVADAYSREEEYFTGHNPGYDSSYGLGTMLLVGADALGAWGRRVAGSLHKEDEISARGPVIQVHAAKSQPSLYYSITQHGQVVSHHIRAKAVHCHKYSKTEYPIAYQVEEDIHRRHVEDAHLHLEQLRSDPELNTSQRQQQMVKNLEDALVVPPPFGPDDWSIDSLPNKKDRRVSRRLWNDDDLWDHAVNTFKQDLQFWSSRLPPSSTAHPHIPLDTKSFDMSQWPETNSVEKSPIEESHIEESPSEQSPIEKISSPHAAPIGLIISDNLPEDDYPQPLSAPVIASTGLSPTAMEQDPIELTRSRSTGSPHNNRAPSRSSRKTHTFSLRRVFSRHHTREGKEPVTEQEETSESPTVQPRNSRIRNPFLKHH